MTPRPLFFENVPLAPLSTLEVGGKARLFTQLHALEDLSEILLRGEREGLPLFWLGGGSNLLFPDGLFQALVVRNHLRGVTPLPEGVEALSGTPLMSLVAWAARSGWSGLEPLAGIPGTLGGALSGNVGANGRELFDLVQELTLFREGRWERLSREGLSVSYRNGPFPPSTLFYYSCRLRLRREDPAVVRQRCREFILKRLEKIPGNPPKVKSAGSFFRNPTLPSGEKRAAGFLLERVGAKGMRVGGAGVSEKHANFLVNLGEATCADFLGLADLLRERVKETFGVELQQEVLNAWEHLER